MKKNLLFLSLIFTSISFAQTTITKVFNDPTIGDVVNNVNVNGTVNNSATGNNVNFDNTTLTSGSAVVNNYTAPTASESSTYTGTTIKHFDGSNTIYYKQNASNLEIVGLTAAGGTANFSANPAIAITYPTAYGNTFTDTVAGTAVFNGTTVSLSGTVNTTADAAGTLLMGGNSYPNILRLKIVLNMNITLSGIPVGTLVNTMYMYFDNFQKYPLLNHTILAISGAVTQNSESAQAQSYTFLGTDETSIKPKFVFYPNPAKDFIKVSSSRKIENKATIFTLEGRLIKNISVEDGSIDVSDLKSGSYMLLYTDDTGLKNTFKFIKE